ASPLPAPPDAQVFTNQLALEMRSEGFVPGGPTEGFEPDTRTASLNPAVAPTESPANGLLDRLRALRAGRPGNIDLHLQSSPGLRSEPVPAAIPPPAGPVGEEPPR